MDGIRLPAEPVVVLRNDRFRINSLMPPHTKLLIGSALIQLSLVQQKVNRFGQRKERRGDPIRDAGTSDQQFSSPSSPSSPPSHYFNDAYDREERKRLLPVQHQSICILVRSGVRIES